MAMPACSPGTGTYFVTSVTSGRRRLFQVAGNAELTPQGVAIERAMGFITGGFSRRLESKLAVWQRGFTDHRVRDADDFQTRREYIHQNPVRAHIVDLAEKYVYSSAYRVETGKPYLGALVSGSFVCGGL